MKKVFILLLLYIWINQNAFAQETKTELLNFLQTELNIGTHTYRLMTVQAIPSKMEVPLLIGENGKILDSNFDMNRIESAPTFQFKTSGSIKLKMEYKDSLLIIRPNESSFFPLIKIDLKSLTASINVDQMDMVKPISIRNKKNGFNSEWHGFQWQVKSRNNSSTINPRLTLGKLEENGEIYMEILWFENGNTRHYRLLG